MNDDSIENEHSLPGTSGRSIRTYASVTWRIITKTAKLYDEHDCAIRAAGVAYHLLLSIFPLLLFLVFLGSHLLSSDEILPSIRAYLNATIPAAAPDVERVLDQTLQARGSFGLIGALLLLWSASVLFTSVTETMNVIWRGPQRSFWRRRLIAIVAVLAIGLLFVISIWLSPLTVLPLPDETSLSGQVLRYVLDPGLIILFLWLIFRVLPNRSVDPQAAFAGALLAGIVWRAARKGFVWFLASGLANYGLVYGSVASVIVLMLWAYMSGVILYLGAVIGSVLEMMFVVESSEG
ncbi:MAG: YihY family inner membrane protein [Anaerolineales bacterium]|nr:YihY family inner membrane protein [Anaerolineales bacterium]